MPQAHVFTLSLSLLSFVKICIPLFASAAVLQPSISPTHHVPLTLSPTTNLTTTLNDQIRCVPPYPRAIDPVSFRTCQPTIDRLLSYPWANTPRTYRLTKGEEGIVKITTTVCAISLDRRVWQGEITLSLRQIVQSVMRILSVCSQFGEGGWQYLDSPWVDWIVVVHGTGELDVERDVNGTLGGEFSSG